MTTFLLVLGFFILLIAAWAPARIRALHSGQTRFDSRHDSSPRIVNGLERR
jgi:hypothetical protein